MSSAVDAKYIGYRQVANGAHPAWTFPVAMMIAHVPLAIAESLAFGVVAYAMAGMTLEAGRFFFFFLCIFLCDVFSATLFRTFAFSAPTLISRAPCRSRSVRIGADFIDCSMPFTISRHCVSVGVLFWAIAGAATNHATQTTRTLTVFMFIPSVHPPLFSPSLI